MPAEKRGRGRVIILLLLFNSLFGFIEFCQLLESLGIREVGLSFQRKLPVIKLRHHYLIEADLATIPRERGRPYRYLP